MKFLDELSVRLGRFIVKEKFVIGVAAGVIIAATALSFFSFPIARSIEAGYFGLKTSDVLKGLSVDQGYVYQQVGDAASSADLIAAIKKRSVIDILKALRSEEDMHGLTALTATDENGVVFIRTRAVSRSGDYLFEETPYGRKVAEGMTTVSIEQGIGLPLLVIAGFPVKDEGKMIGGIFGGYAVDDAYAHAFRHRYLKGDANLVFYSKKAGVVGTTFEDPGTRSLLASYVNTGSDWVQNARSDQEVIVEGKSYFIKNIVLSGIGGNSGGVIVFYPFNYGTEAGLRALFFALLFFYVALYFHAYRAKRKCYFDDHLKLWMFTLFIFLICFAQTILGLQRGAIVFQKPPFTIYNSTLGLQPDSGIFDRSYEQQVTVRVSTGGEAVNAAQLRLAYDPAKLRVTEILTASSFCSSSMFLEKEIDNKKGEVRVACALPAPGFSGEGTVVELKIQPLQEGEATLHFAEGTRVLANDGLGTDVLRLATDGGYTIADARSSSMGSGVPPMLVFSPTHPNVSRWYNQSNALITWVTRPGYAYLYSLDEMPAASTLAGASSTALGSVVLKALSDGVHYFHIAAEKEGATGPISDFKLMIDTTPPDKPTIQISQSTVSEGEIVRLVFASDDRLSGPAASYYIKFNGGILLPAASPLYLAFPPGSHAITVRAFDKAGNFSENSVPINVKNVER